MAKISRYFLTASNTFSEFSLNDPAISLADAQIYVQGTEGIDHIYVAKGFSLDFTESKGGVDQIYLSGALADYKFYSSAT